MAKQVGILPGGMLVKDILVPWSLPLVRGRFLTRLHRFGAWCQVQGEEVLVHVPATGRMRELLITGVPVGLRPAPPSAQNRKTAWTLVLVRHRGLWVHVDSTGPTRILPALLRRGLLEEFRGYTGILPEPRIPAPAGGTAAVGTMAAGVTAAGARFGDAS
ncbi:MAG: hypothetical protein M1602_04795, partial [Firmicutes bacterium]|nr:hypothetical protein [Bacillota bacterium]